MVTCIVSGNQEGGIDISAYQATNSAMAMVDADIIEASVEPAVMLVKPETETRYIPDVFYRKVNEHKVSVQENAKPAFPVEYLFVTLTHGFPQSPDPLFNGDQQLFPIENRGALGKSQDIQGVRDVLLKVVSTPEILQQVISNFHLLIFIHSLGILSVDDEQLLQKAATSHEVQDLYQLLESPSWNTLLAILNEV